MTITELCTAVAEALQAWVETYGGKALVTQGPAHTVELLAAKPGAPLVAVVFDADVPSDVDTSGLVRRRFKTILSFPRTLKIVASDELLGEGGHYMLVEEAREVVRQLTLDAESGAKRANWTGTAVYQVGDLLFDAWESSFEVAACVPVARET